MAFVTAMESFSEPHSIGSIHVSSSSCVLCYYCRDFQYPVRAVNCLGMTDDPKCMDPKCMGWHCCPALHWNVKHGTWGHGVRRWRGTL